MDWSVIRKIKDEVERWMAPHEENGHGGTHCVNVWLHSKHATDVEDLLTDEQKLAVQLAALLHEVDDHKLFKKSKNLENARAMLREVGIDKEMEEMITLMISIVSFANPNIPTKYRAAMSLPKWMGIPRDCDRLEALGEEGIKRCYQYTKHIGNPLFTLATPRPTTREELRKIVTEERLDNYVKYGKSASMIDHYYDKLLHCGYMRCENPYVVRIAQERMSLMEDYVLDFGRTGVPRIPDGV